MITIKIIATATLLFQDINKGDCLGIYQTTTLDKVGTLARIYARRADEVPFDVVVNDKPIIEVRWHGPATNRYYVITQHRVHSKVGV